MAATIDTADPARQPVPKPDLRKCLTPLGPVAIDQDAIGQLSSLPEVNVFDEDWTEEWPPEGPGTSTTQLLEALPRAVRITMEIEDYGTFSFSVPGVGG